MSRACFSISRWELCRSWILVKKWCERRWHITLCPHATHGVKKGGGGASIDRTASAEGSFLKDKIPRKSWCARVIGPPRTAYRFNLVDLCRCFSILLPHGSRTTIPSKYKVQFKRGPNSKEVQFKRGPLLLTDIEIGEKDGDFDLISLLVSIIGKLNYELRKRSFW